MIFSTHPLPVVHPHGTRVASRSCYRTASTHNAYAAIRYLDAAEALTADDRLLLLCSLARSAALRALGRLDEALTAASFVVDRLREVQLPLSIRITLESRALIAEGIALALRGDLAGGEGSIRHGLGLADRDRVPSWQLEAHGWLAFIAVHQGAVDAALPHLERAHALGDETGTSADLAGLPALFAESLLASDRGQYAQAREGLLAAASVGEGTEYEVLRLHLLAVAWGGDRGDFEQFGLLQEAGVLLQSWPTPSLYEVNHETVRAIALLQSGSPSGARDAITGLRLALERVPDPRHVVCACRLEARLALHVGEYEHVLEATRPCRTLGDDHAPRTRAYVDALRAAAHLQLGDLSTAATAIDRALLTAARTGWRRPLALLPADILRHMLDSAGSREPSAEVSAVIGELQREPSDGATPFAPLSERERVILGHLTAGLSRQQISALLHVSPNTVKSQARSLYAKLGASSRHEAVERATRYGIRV